jgi:hypothetical protein
MSNIYVCFDCDDINPNLEDGRYNIKRLKKVYPEMTICYFVPQFWHACTFLNNLGVKINDFSKTSEPYYEADEIGYHGMLHMNQAGQGECEMLCTTDYLKECMKNSVLYTRYNDAKLVRPPGWLITPENIKYLKDNEWTIADHQSKYTNIDIISIDEPIRKPLAENVILHCHIAARCGKNNIDSVENYNNTVEWIEYLSKNYDLKWDMCSNIYKRGILK